MKKVKFLIISVCLFITSFILVSPILNKPFKDIDIHRFNTVLLLKENKLGMKIHQVYNSTITGGINKLITNDGAKLETYLNKNGLRIFVYINDTLCYWSSSKATVPDRFSSINKEKRISFWGNTWFFTTIFEKDNVAVLGLVDIKTVYPIHNNYLSSHFQYDFNLANDISISLTQLKGDYPVYDANHNFLFSLVSKKHSSSKSLLQAIAFFIGIISLIFLVAFILNLKISQPAKFYFLTILLLIVRFVLLKIHLPLFLEQLDIFKPGLYNSSRLTPTFGDFILHALFVFCFAFAFYKWFLIKLNTESKYINFIILLIELIVNYSILITYKIIEDLVINSSITYEVYKIEDFTPITLLGFLILSLFLASFVLITIRISILLGKLINFRKLLYWHLSIGLLMFISYRLAFDNFGILPIVFLHAVTIILFYINHVHQLNFFTQVGLIFFLSLFSFFIISEESIAKEKRYRKVLAYDLSAEHDPVAELLLEDVEKKITTDTVIQRFIKQNIYNNYNTFYDYIQEKYFIGFWTKYNLQITICSPGDSLFVQPDNNTTPCFDFFSQMIEQQGKKLGNSNFYFLDNQSGQISYFGIFRFNEIKYPLRIFIELDSKLISEELGYPELLYDQNMYYLKNYARYNYANYKNGKLISQQGNFAYSLNLSNYGNFEEEYAFFNYKDFNHLLCKISKQTSIIISKPVFTFFDGLISISYLFVYFYIISLIIVTVHNYYKHNIIKHSFKRQIQFSMISILLVSLILIGGSTIYYNIRQYQIRHYKSISEKLQSIKVELDHKLGYEKELNEDLYEYIESILIKFSNVFFTDINLYNNQGNLIATSRPEVFSKNLTGTKMDPDAWSEMSINKQIEYIHQEEIGSMQYTSAYAPFYNHDNVLLAYLNVPYFSKQSDLTEEISGFVVAIINTYVLLILLAILMAVFFSRQITQPLKYLQDKFRKVDFGKHSEQISYSKNDEIGSLIKEYNRMVVELEEQAELLAKSERESAWREMARQIAHEIKNPLTPMKLNVQLLQRLYNDKVDDFNERLQKTTQSLIEQINSLSAIANDFYSFAKMPKANLKILNIVDILKNSIVLFENSSYVQFMYDFDNTGKIEVFADEEQILRVFNNIIKNSIQALQDISNPVITIEIEKKSEFVIIVISDNGKGIPDDLKNKLFQPNFTTKTSGMGLGLAIVKNIVENSKGHISFETKLNKGTTFTVSFPLNN